MAGLELMGCVGECAFLPAPRWCSLGSLFHVLVLLAHRQFRPMQIVDAVDEQPYTEAAATSMQARIDAVFEVSFE